MKYTENQIMNLPKDDFISMKNIVMKNYMIFNMMKKLDYIMF